MRDEATEHAAFEKLVGGSEKAFRLLYLYCNSFPTGTEYDRLFKRGRTKEQSFILAARDERFPETHINAFLALQI